MANDVRGPGQKPPTRDELIAQSEAKADADFAAQLKMNDLQAKVNSQNTFITAMSSLQKGQDDVLRAIANNFK